MHSAPGCELLPAGERQLFVEQFERDLQFFQLFILLINRSCPVKNVDLVWVENGQSGRAGLRHMGTTQALAGPCSRLLGFGDRNPHPFFCNIINDYGRHETESCGVSDKAAEDIVRQTGKAHVYRCHFGLIDIAVPVVVNGQHIATLFSGQVLRDPPTTEGFVQITKDVAALNYVDLNKLEKAYREVSVVSEEDLKSATDILEAFAEYLANSWLRLAEAVKERRRRDREMQLARKEFAYLALEWDESGAAGPGTEEVRELMRKVGFTRPPNRVLVVRLDHDEEGKGPATGFETGFAAAFQAVEEICEKQNNTAAAWLRKTGICVFFYDPGGPRASANHFAHRLATRILHAIGECCELRARVGLGNLKDEWPELAKSYREACLALSCSESAVVSYRKPAGSFEDLSARADEICRLIAERQPEAARSAAAALPTLVSRQIGSDREDLANAGMFFSSAVDSMCLTARDLNCEAAAIGSLCDKAGADLGRASDFFQMREVWLRFAGDLLDEVQRLYTGKHTKIVERTCWLIEHNLSQGQQHLTISEIAAELSISASHLSRTFKRETGQTFEQFLTAKRVELAERLLLDPLNNISQVAQRCGFADPSYFARVFRKTTGCSPREYCKHPQSNGRARLAAAGA